MTPHLGCRCCHSICRYKHLEPGYRFLRAHRTARDRGLDMRLQAERPHGNMQIRGRLVDLMLAHVTEAGLVDEMRQLAPESGLANAIECAVSTPGVTAGLAPVIARLVQSGSKAASLRPGSPHPRCLTQRGGRRTSGAGGRVRSGRRRSPRPDARALFQNWGAFVAEVGPLVVPILLLIRTAAASDAEMAALYEEAEAARLEWMEHNARHLHDRGHLREDVTLAQGRDVLWTYSSPELFELLVLRRGWSPEQFGPFASDGRSAALLPRADGG